MSQRKRLTSEMFRILKASRDGRLQRIGVGGRWTIVGESLPKYQDRALLQKRLLLRPSYEAVRTTPMGVTFVLSPTDRGLDALRDIEAHDFRLAPLDISEQDTKSAPTSDRGEE